jgi:hypothetical protein
MYRFPRSAIFVLLLALLACSQTPTLSSAPDAPVATFTPYVSGTQTALASANATPFASDANGLSTPTPVIWPRDFTHVTYGGKVYQNTFFLLLGGVSSDGWLAPDASVAHYSGEATYSLHNMEHAAKYFLWGQAPHYSVICQTYSIGTEVELEEGGFVATLDGWTVTKRAVTELAADSEFYQQATLEWLAAQGVQNPQLGDLQIFRVDLEGDGLDEIFISATRLESQHTTQSGHYSVVLMRKVVGNEVVTVLVAGDVYDSREQEMTFPLTYTPANFIDLNQDGILEVVVEFRGWEKFGASVHQVEGQEVRQVLGAGC